MALDRFSKERRWYYQDINGHIKPESRKLLEEYSHIPPRDVDTHIYKLVSTPVTAESPISSGNPEQRDALWSHAPYPCVGEFKFLTLNLLSHPTYPHLLSILSRSRIENSSQPIQLLDLGCCVAQELRSLVHAGIPSSQLYGCDLNADFLTTSYALFNDKDSFEGTLVPANVFEESIFEKAWKGWEGKFGIIHAGLFLHLFNWKQQLAVCEKIIRLMSDERGTLFLGEMVGCEGGGERGGVKLKGEVRKQYLHDAKSFEKLWREVAEKTGTVGMWKVEGSFKKGGRMEESDENHGHSRYFTGEDIRWFSFSVERI
jgi:hypothetical protein